MKHVIATVICMCGAAPVGAHPHVFIDTGLEFRFDDMGRLTQVKVTWVYDEFYSLLVTEDFQLDPDFDGKLTPAEQDTLTGFDMRWIEGFNGDLEIAQGNGTLTLSGPNDVTASLADGRITTTHVRDVTGHRTDGASLVARPYDATYYTAYDVTRPVTLDGADDCAVDVQAPDLNAGLMALQEELSTLDADQDPEDAGLPNIGEKLATNVVISCAAP